MIKASDDTKNGKELNGNNESKDNKIEATKSITYEIGDYVELQTNKKNTTRKGYIRFKGKIESFGDCVGIELDEKITDGNNGTVNDKEYFKCSQGKGTFIKIAKIIQKLPNESKSKSKIDSTTTKKKGRRIKR